LASRLLLRGLGFGIVDAEERETMAHAHIEIRGIAGRQSSILQQQLISVGKQLYDRGLQTTRSGNISVRNGDVFLITRTGTNLGKLRHTDLITVDVHEAAPIPAGASCETQVHRAIYNAGEARAIVHAHPAYAIALADFAGERGVTPVHNEGLAGLKWIPVVGTSVRGKEGGEDPTGIAAQLKSWPSVIVRGHGAFAVGASLDEALYRMFLLEDVCKIACIVQSLKRDR
jgi:L-fuculose-phosphate aldolase